MKAQMESWQDIQEYVKNNKKKHKRRMANDAMKNVNELGFPFAYFEHTYQFAIKTPIGMVDYFGTTGTWVVRMNQDRGRGLKKLKKYLEHPVPTKEIKKIKSNQSWMTKSN
ncbi:hypothetical protein [Enterococcus faecalis]|uniref:hypothetical protein n=1 Tax=Enterococcus faecalis TaxID=1351 RepID=UPI00287FDE2F|nr:hypothetical protein [Enterococcus faecalis]